MFLSAIHFFFLPQHDHEGSQNIIITLVTSEEPRKQAAKREEIIFTPTGSDVNKKPSETNL